MFGVGTGKNGVESSDFLSLIDEPIKRDEGAFFSMDYDLDFSMDYDLDKKIEYDPVITRIVRSMEAKDCPS